ncbi:MAG TPA: sugar phosphate isomerase/epimerase family protein, partial [Bryobacteraceae bacterium]|nr:sugar phosphate isomerase/epimerase family protein [Bryobacteraceae bacterium]
IAPPLRAAAPSRIRVGTCTLDLKAAREAGLDGVEIRAGNAADTLEIADPKKIAAYKADMAETGLPICSIMMGLLNSHPLATEPRAPGWLEQTIAGAAALGAKNILVAFFGKGNLVENGRVKEDEFKVVVERLRAAAPRAADAGVILAVESMLNAEQNERLLDAVGHPAVRIYYDVFNTKSYGVPAEIRRLGRRISQLHYKNGPRYLEDDADYFAQVTAAVQEIGFSGWVVLETSSPSNDRVADARRNGAFVRKLFA